MSDKPKKQIQTSSAANAGKVGLGLTPHTVQIEACHNALVYLSKGKVTLGWRDNKWALIGDRNSPTAQGICAFYLESLKDEELKDLSEIQRLATIINRLAIELDEAAPTLQGVPTRMQALWLIQHQPERKIEL